MDRRNSKEGQPQRPPNNPDVFDDEYALDHDEDDFMPSVSDGFRPTGTTDGWNSDRHDHDRNEPARPQITPTKSADSVDLRRVATRNSTAKVPFPRNSMSQEDRNPGIPPPPRGPSSQATPLQHRESVSSTASFATMARSESPFTTGPSHPYGMYPQNTMARNSSIASTSTQQAPPRPTSIQRPSGPSHPYGMYSQNVVEDEPPMPRMQTAIPVGFPGINTGFHRQIGPDGEEQDIIGPDGHTEQLPPYTRYPEEGPTKASMAAEASATPVESTANPMAASNDALLTNVAPPSPVSPMTPTTPPVTSVAPALLPQQRPETQTGSVAAPRPATTSESASLLTTEESVSEKPEIAQSIKKTNWRSKRLWGKVPITVALVLFALLLIFAVVLGVAIGTFVGKGKDKDKNNKHPNKPEDPAAQVTPPHSLFDATPISTPTSLPPLPTGQFSLPLGFAQESSPGCLVQGNQYSAWSCKMSFAPLMLSITNTTNNDPTLQEDFLIQAGIEAFVAPDGNVQYGLQSPKLQDNVTMQLVTDLDYKGYGPAWHFSARYDKLVVLSPDEFAAGASLKKRQDDKPFRHRFQVQPGDNPWFCYWNLTYIEGYIYAQDNSTAATMTNFPTPNPSDPFGPMQTPPPETGTAVTTSTPTPTSPPNRKRQGGPPPFPRLPPYPRIVKIEERRIPGAPQPYCQKMQLLDNGQMAQATSDNGSPIMVPLQEQDPSLAEYGGPPPPDPSEASERRRRALRKRRDPSDACHCQWMFQ